MLFVCEFNVDISWFDCLVYDGDELSSYDEQDFAEQQRENDAEVMKRLELEIASETGLMAAGILLTV